MIIDTHFHAFPGKFLDLLPEAKNDVRGVGFHAFDPLEYLNVMDKYGIDIGVLSNTGGRIEKGGDQAKALELCRVLNDGFAEAHAKYPQRFLAFARLPMLDMEDCVRELERCYKDLKMHGVMMPTNVAGKYIDEPEFKTVLGCTVRRWQAVVSSPGQRAVPIELGPIFTASEILWPTDSTLVLARIVYAGIFDSYPNLKLIASHLGGMILLYLDRLNWREGNPLCKEDPKFILRKYSTIRRGLSARRLSNLFTTRWARSKFFLAPTILMDGTVATINSTR